MSNPLTTPVQHPTSTERPTIGAWFAAALSDLLDGFPPTSLPISVAQSLEDALGEDWTRLRDAIDEALVDGPQRALPPLVPEGTPIPQAASTQPLETGQVRITIETPGGTSTALMVSDTGRVGRGFAEHAGHSVSNYLTGIWGPFGAERRDEPTPPASPATKAAIARVHGSAVKPRPVVHMDPSVDGGIVVERTPVRNTHRLASTARRSA